MKLLMILSLLFYANSHPLSLILILISMTLLSSFFISLFLKSSWFSLVFILIMLGGMLVLFIYIASLASNEPFILNKSLYLLPLVLVMPTPSQMDKTNFLEMHLFTMFGTNSAINNMVAILYLLIALLVVMEIISCYKAPLRANI